MMFEEKKDFRLREVELKKILSIVNKNKVYKNTSHFIRCAVIKLIREKETKQLKERLRT